MKRLGCCVGVLVGWLVVGSGLPVWAQEEAAEEGSAIEALTGDIDPPAAQADTGEAPERLSETAQAAEEAAPVDEGLISIDFKDADIRQVLRIVAIKSGIDIVAGADVEGEVTIKLTDIPWEQALDTILRTYGLTYERRGRIIRVMTIEALELEALTTEVFPLNYATAAEVPGIINEMLSDRGRVRFDERTNTVIVTDVPSSVFQIQQVIERIDQRTPQVLIDTMIVETTLNKDENLGFRWDDAFAVSQTQTAFASTFPFVADSTLGGLGDMFVASPVPIGEPSNALLTATGAGNVGVGTLTGPQFTLTLNLLKERVHTRIVSNPSLAVLNNQEARIHIGQDFPVPNFSVDPQTGLTTVSGFDTRTIGTLLVVTPHVNPAREIVVDLAPEIVTSAGNETFLIGANAANTVSLPRFNTQTVQTQVRIASGETIAIGGLVRTEKRETEHKVPFLGDLPIIGALFTNTNRDPFDQQDLLIFLTVTLMEDDHANAAVASTASDQP